MSWSFSFPWILCLALFVTSCDSGPPPQQTLDERFIEKQNLLAEPLAQLLKELEKTTTGFVSRRSKPETPVVAEADSPTTFGFPMRYGNEPKLLANAILLYDSPLLLSQSAEEGQMFGEQRMLYDLSAALSKTASEFESQMNEPSRQKRFTSMVEATEAYLENLQYFFFVHEKKRFGPSPRGSNYIGGTYEARLMVYERGNPQPIAERNISAGSSEGVTAKEFGGLAEKIARDFDDNVDKAIKEAVRSVGSIRGDVDKMRFRE